MGEKQQNFKDWKMSDGSCYPLNNCHATSDFIMDDAQSEIILPKLIVVKGDCMPTVDALNKFEFPSKIQWVADFIGVPSPYHSGILCGEAYDKSNRFHVVLFHTLGTNSNPYALHNCNEISQ